MTFTDQIREAGVVGCGGAGFPTHVKYAGTAETFIINGAECEPLLRTDRYLMLRHAPRLVAAVEQIGKHLGATHSYIALKETYTEEIAALEAAISAASSPVELFRLGNYYPAGDEQMIVRDITGKTVPPAGIPLDVGAVVSNVATALAVADAVEGTPFTHKVLTITGEVGEPTILRVPVGTAIRDCIQQAGGYTGPGGYAVIDGGPLMGKVLRDDGDGFGVVTKTTSGLIALPSGHPRIAQTEINVQHTVNRARSSCIQCTYCTAMCPRFLTGHPLEPHRIMRLLAYSGSIQAAAEDESAKGALLCCECGICEDYACPMSLQPRRVNALLKAEFAKSGTRYSRDDGPWEASEEREYRKIPSKRIAARTGVLPYYSYTIQTLKEWEPDAVTIPLRQHIGAPAQPLVKVGDTVTAGQKIGACPEQGLGANIHTGIAGRVVRVDSAITIQRGNA